MLYIYESHMGGLYSTDYEQDWENLHCDQCGDSDWLVGSCKDDDMEAAWDLIKPGNICCNGCEHEETCVQDCNKVEANSLNYDLLYTQKFLFGLFPDARRNVVYLITRDKKTGEVYVNCAPAGYSFGEAHAIPYAFCHKDELVRKMVPLMLPAVGESGETKLLRKTTDEDGNEYVYEYVVERDEESSEGASYTGDDWYGWIAAKDLRLTEEQNHLNEIIQNG